MAYLIVVIDLRKAIHILMTFCTLLRSHLLKFSIKLKCYVKKFLFFATVYLFIAFTL